MKTLLLVIFMSVGMFGCGPGVQDEVRHLAGRYYYVDTSPHYAIIAPKIREPNSPYIPEKVVAFEYNSAFIVAAQRSVTLLDKPKPGYSLGTDRKYWIVITASDNVIGPLAQNDFRSACIANGVPAQLWGKLLKDHDQGRN